MSLSRRGLVRMISYSLAIILTLTAALLLSRYETAALRRSLTAHYRRSYFELISSLESIESSLAKASVSSSPESLALLSCNIWNSAEAAGQHLGELPYELSNNSQTTAFLNRVGSFSYTLVSAAGKGDTADANHQQTLLSLRGAVKDVLRSLSAVSAYIYEDSFFETADFSENMPDDAYSLSSGMTLLESAFPETPTLLYDGPYSEHLTGLSPKINEKPEISADDAVSYVASLYGASASSVQLEGEVSGDIPCYLISLRNGRSLSLLVTRHGGRLLGITSSGSIDGAVLSESEAEQAAMRFLDKAGYKNLTVSYHHAAGGVSYINLEGTQDDVILYPDLIQVGVSLADGEIISFDARGYLSNHTDREFAAPVLSEEEMLEKLSDSLTVDGVKLALIPTEGKNEIFCREIACHSREGDRYLFYINCENGREEKIMLLQEDENGILAF